MLVAELDGDLVLAGRRWQVRDRDGAVLVVVAGDLGLARALDGQRETARARALRRDREGAGLAADAVDQARPVGRHVAARQRVHVELERRAWGRERELMFRTCPKPLEFFLLVTEELALVARRSRAMIAKVEWSACLSIPGHFY